MCKTGKGILRIAGTKIGRSEIPGSFLQNCYCYFFPNIKKKERRKEQLKQIPLALSPPLFLSVSQGQKQILCKRGKQEYTTRGGM